MQIDADWISNVPMIQCSNVQMSKCQTSTRLNFCRSVLLEFLRSFLTSKPSLTIALKILKTIEKPLTPMVGPSKTFNGDGATLSKPLKNHWSQWWPEKNINHSTPLKNWPSLWSTGLSICHLFSAFTFFSSSVSSETTLSLALLPNSSLNTIIRYSFGINLTISSKTKKSFNTMIFNLDQRS